MTDIFNCKTEMPAQKEVVSVAMTREEAPFNEGRLSGERKWPERAVANLEPRRRGHGY